MITTAQIASAAKGRHKWIAFSLDPPHGIERARLAKLARLLTPRKVRDVRWSLDVDRGRLAVAWTCHGGRQGWILFRMGRVPFRNGQSWTGLETFRAWGEDSP